MKVKKVGKGNDDMAIMMSFGEYDDRRVLDELCGMPEGSKLYIYVERPDNKYRIITVKVVSQK